MDTKHFSFRIETQLFKELEGLKPKGISMSSFLVHLIEQGKSKPESVYDNMASKEVHINAAVNKAQYDKATKEDDGVKTFQLNQSPITFNEIIEKHKVELEEKYG